MIVVDASALLEALRRTASAKSLEDRLLAPHEMLHAPHLLNVEIAQVIRRYAASGILDAIRDQPACLNRHPVCPDLPGRYDGADR